MAQLISQYKAEVAELERKLENEKTRQILALREEVAARKKKRLMVNRSTL